jgi:hypothetical protein
MATPVFVTNANYTCPAGKTATLHVYAWIGGGYASLVPPCNEVPLTATSVATNGPGYAYGSTSASVILAAGQSLTYYGAGSLTITGWVE